MQTIEQFLDEWTAAERTGDVAALDGLVADDFVGVGPLGFSLDKPAWLDRHRTRDLTYESFDVDELQPRVHPGTVAVITARIDARGSYRGFPTPQVLRTTISLVGAGERWRMVGAHMSFVAGTPGAPPLPAGAGQAVA